MTRHGDVEQSELWADQPAMDRRMTDLFNAGVAAHALATAHELGLIDRLHRDGSVELRPRDEPASQLELDYLVHLLSLVGIVERIGGSRIVPGPAFDAAYSYKGFFAWLFAASGSVLASAASFVGSEPQHRAMPRDGSSIGKASGDFGRIHLDPSILALPEWSDASHVADIGCGDGTRLARIADAWPVDALGIDVNVDAVNAARQTIGLGGLAGRVDIVRADARALEHERGRTATVDTIFCALMGHDLWPRATCVATLHRWQAWFPRAERLILCETVRAERDAPLEAHRIPTLGYEYLHAVMGQYIPSESEWVDVLAEAGWPVVRRVSVAMPAETVIFVCEARRA